MWMVGKGTDSTFKRFRISYRKSQWTSRRNRGVEKEMKVYILENGLTTDPEVAKKEKVYGEFEID